MATAEIRLDVQAAKVNGSYITAGARIDGGQGPWKLLFATDSTESGLWQLEAPTNYASGPVAKLKYAMASAVANKVDPEFDVMAIADGEDVDTASFDSINEIAGGTTVPGTAGFRDTIEISLANNDSMAVEETILLRGHRDHDDGDDTAAGDMEWVGLVFEYTTT